MVVPLNWLEPQGEFFEVSLIRKAGSEQLPALVVNPGGPGASGVNFVKDSYEQIGTSNLRSSFQIIGFDPRGVGESAPVTCTDIELKDEVYYGWSPYEFGSTADLEWSKDLIERFAASCQTVGFDVAYFNTQQTARDLELLRILLGLEQIDYIGYSYGSELGAVYAALFPDRVGKFVLDGAADPTIGAGQTLLNQIVGFDSAFRAYLENCLTITECPFSGDVESSLLEVKAMLNQLEAAPLATDFGRDLSVTAAIYGIIAALYSQDSWVYLSQALSEALQGDGTTLMLLADFYNDRDPDGGYTSNINEANVAISCADDRVREGEANQLRPALLNASEVFGKYFSYAELSCAGWPEGKGMLALDFEISLANGPLVIGTTGDPATPYSQAVSMSELLDGARLVTYEGEGHTAYGSVECVNEYVEAYLAGETLPDDEMRCS